MNTQDVSQADFEQQVIQASFQQPVVIDFWAPWCAPCNVLKPILEKLAEEYGGKFKLAKVNSDENQEIAARYAVRGIPSVKAMVASQTAAAPTKDQIQGVWWSLRRVRLVIARSPG